MTKNFSKTSKLVSWCRFGERADLSIARSYGVCRLYIFTDYFTCMHYLYIGNRYFDLHSISITVQTLYSGSCLISRIKCLDQTKATDGKLHDAPAVFPC
jgi:hypothetical protein